MGSMHTQAEGHAQSYRELVTIWGALLCLTAVTVAVSRLDLGSLRIATALSIAVVKSTLVLLFFMHMKWAPRAVVITFFVTILILAAVIGFMFFDVAYR
jgi:cytochrome c oxidase subunit IV